MVEEWLLNFSAVTVRHAAFPKIPRTSSNAISNLKFWNLFEFSAMEMIFLPLREFDTLFFFEEGNLMEINKLYFYFIRIGNNYLI
jgi:hypothetical protein